ncbi:protein phosphatase 2C domain-containing protein [Amycolatopsis sp. WAC 04182]|uniref:protein phosphatase 2C domain-containing protein n=1 Tax=Amycolatopsis sp. WAC 04182 TaxID=2203198 RepID=UPI001315083C|nr:protein phosphatase 2C domain-containing protein [Amycolatopsis sp. WAC 04182]
MDIHPGNRGNARLWHHAESGFISVAVRTEKIANEGEDADPLVLYHRPSASGLLSVFDGVGGAGRPLAGHTPSGRPRTQAWLASRRVRGLVEEWFTDSSADFSPEALAARISGRLATGVVRRGRMRGRLQRQLPTTLAALAFDSRAGEVSWQVLWAGDSRCFLAEPEAGLQQLSADDTEPADALALLLQDPPMTNMVHAGGAFAINRWRGTAPVPCVLIAATDGFFGYVGTPAEFEHLLWDTLLASQEAMHWSVLLAERVESFTKDDASIAIAAVGFEDFAALRASFRWRFDRVHEEHAEPMRRATSMGRPAVVATRERSWLSYRGGYERRLPPREGIDS